MMNHLLTSFKDSQLTFFFSLNCANYCWARSLFDEHGHALLRLLEEDHALGDPPREDVVPDGAALEHLAVDDLVGLAQVAQDYAAVARVPRVDDVEHVEHLDMEGKVMDLMIFSGKPVKEVA